MALKITSNDIDHLSWIFSRMKSVHGESENLDYMRLFREIIDNLRSDYSCGENKVETPEEKEALDAIEQPKRTKVVYEKVATVFSLDRNKMNSGSYGALGDDGDFYPTYDEVSTVRALIKDSLHIKSEKPIDWWEESVDYVVAIKGDAKGVLYSNGILSIDASMTHDQWCDFARILLEQESE